MSKYDWEEVKRLAADFQRTQLSSSSQKISEKNCVEIITKLTQLKLLDVVFTNDGKVFITPKYLIKEIKDELYVQNGRANLIDIAKALNVDYNVISSLAHEIVKEEPDIKLILGQLIDHSYVTHVAEEINDRLQQHGIVNVIELARNFDLSGDFIHSIIQENNGKVIFEIKQDKNDPQTYYTETFLRQNKAIVRGALVAITKPTLISTVVSHCGMSENIFFSLIDALIESKQIPGVLTERCGNICTYIPRVYLKTQSEWVNSFFQQNSYLEYDALSRVGINDPKSFIAKSLQSEENLQYLRNCAVGQRILDQIEASIEEVINSHSWINILNILPTVIDSDDAEIMLKNAIDKCCRLSQIEVFTQTYAVSKSFLNSVQTHIVEKIVPDKVNEAILSGTYEQYLVEFKTSNASGDYEKHGLTRKEERKKKANFGKSGGGTQVLFHIPGQRNENKSNKKKYGKNTNKADSDEERSNKSNEIIPFEFLTLEEIQNVIENDKSFQDEELDCSKYVEDLVQYLHPKINKIALTQCQTMYEAKLADINNSKRKMNVELQDSIISTYQDLKQYYKGIKEFSDNEECQLLLNKYLLKTTGTQLVNTCFTFISDKNEEVNTAESRKKILSALEDKELKDVFNKLHKSLNGSSLEEFMNAVDNIFTALNIMVRKMDKKKEKALLESHKQALIHKLKETDSPPLVLHLVSLILFQCVTQNVLNASGRFVVNILNCIEKKLPAEKITVLQRYHELVMNIFKLSEDDEAYAAINDELNKVTPFLKELVYDI